jgi:hypothetical protein
MFPATLGVAQFLLSFNGIKGHAFALGESESVFCHPF